MTEGISLVIINTASAKDGKRDGDGTGVGLFIPLPANLASQFPADRGKDKSPAHVTFLYIGKVLPEQEEKLCEILDRALISIGPVTASLNGLEYFTNQHGQRIPHIQVAFDTDLASVRRRVRRELMESGFTVEDSFHQQYKPHSTLGYYEDPKQEYTGEVPVGKWTFNTIEVWGCSKVYEAHMTPVPLQKAASERIRGLMKLADLYPALGLPQEAGPCYVRERIDTEIRNPKLHQHLVDELEADEFDGPDETALYDPILENGPGKSKMLLIEHVQHRMDLRGITVPDLRLTLQNFLKWLNDEKSRQSPRAKRTEEDMAYGKRIIWEDKKLGLETVFTYDRGKYIIITSYWMGVPTPHMPSKGCPIKGS